MKSLKKLISYMFDFVFPNMNYGFKMKNTPQQHKIIENILILFKCSFKIKYPNIALKIIFVYKTVIKFAKS